MNAKKADIGIIGGSGFYSLFENAESTEIDTEFGSTSDLISVGSIAGRRAAFLPRHGSRHIIPPHKVPYKANIKALESLGIGRIIATNAVGSLREEYMPGDFVFFDQFVNLTNGRQESFFEVAPVTHVSAAEPYCSELRGIAVEKAEALGIRYHGKGTVVVINGPIFSTRAESRFFSSQGFHVINMTQYPEVMLARELGICYLGIGIITDYDAGLEGRDEIKPVSAEEVSRVFALSIETSKRLIRSMLPDIPEGKNCNCSLSLKGAVIAP